MTDIVNVPRERDLFEVWYCDHALYQGAPKMKPEDIAKLREDQDYGSHRTALNSKWEAWQGRAALAAAPKAEPVRWTEDMERESRESDYERGFRDGQLSQPEAPKTEQEPVDDDPVCTCCDGTGVTIQTERRCSCVTTYPAPASDELLDLVVRVQRFLEPMRFDRKSDNNMAAELDIAMRAALAKHKGPQS